MIRNAIGLLAALALMTSMASAWHRPTVRPRLEYGIPKRDYKLIEPSATPESTAAATASSVTAIEVGDPLGKKKMRAFAMDQSLLRSLHCSIAQVAFTISDDGQWIFNCRADQNPWFTTQPNAMPPLTLARKLNIETNHLLRNEFTVKVRCYGNSALKETIKTLGKPVLVEIEMPKFMVQRGVPLSIKREPKDIKLGNNGVAQVQQYFSVIHRVEYELSFR